MAVICVITKYAGKPVEELTAAPVNGGIMPGKYIVIFMFLMLATPGIRAQEHVWLHVDGKYIRTSDTAVPPNAIWMGAGAAWVCVWNMSTSQFDYGASWLRSKGVNFVNNNFSTLPGSSGGSGNLTIAQSISTWIAPSIAALKKNSIYANIRQNANLDGTYTASASKTQVWKDHWAAIASYFKNEPWVMGYELFNEPPGTFVDIVRQRGLECLNVIRENDPRHIVILGTDNWTQLWRVEEIWGPLNYRPDATGGQVVFAVHHYPGKWVGYGGGTLQANMAEFSRVKDTHDIPLYVSEFGVSENPWNNNDTLLRQYENDIFEMMFKLRIPWSIWAVYEGQADYNKQGNYAGTSGNCDYYRDIWVDGVYGSKATASAAPAGGGVITPTRVFCRQKDSGSFLIAGSTDSLVVEGVIGNDLGQRDAMSADQVTFSISGAGTWEDGTTGAKQVNAVSGIAAIRVKAANTGGKITVTGTVPNLVSVPFTMDALKMTIRANDGQPLAITANGTDMTCLKVETKDENGNVMTSLYGNCVYSISGPGSLWALDKLTGNMYQLSSRPLEQGVSYILVKAGTTEGTANVTVSLDGKARSSVSVRIGGSGGEAAPPEPAVKTIKVYPNPAAGGKAVKFSNLAERSTLRVYGVSGRLVYTSEAAGGEAVWDGKNSAGVKVLPGLYIYKVTGDTGNRTGKLLIQ